MAPLSGQRSTAPWRSIPRRCATCSPVTGPAALPDGTKVTAANVVALTQSTVYTKFPRRTRPRASPSCSPSPRLRATGCSPRRRHDSSGEGGRPRRPSGGCSSTAGPCRGEGPQRRRWRAPSPTRPRRTSACRSTPAATSSTTTSTSLTWRGPAAEPPARVTVTISLTNTAPAAGLSPYLTTAWTAPLQGQPGDSRDVIATSPRAGATLRAVEINGRPAAAARGVDRGHPVFRTDLELPRGRPRRRAAPARTGGRRDARRAAPAAGASAAGPPRRRRRCG